MPNDPATAATPAPSFEDGPALPARLQEIFDDVAIDLEIGSTCTRVAAAQRLIEAALDLLCGVARETNDRNAEAYIIYPLRIVVGDGHGLLTRDDNLDCWQRRLRKAEGLDDE